MKHKRQVPYKFGKFRAVTLYATGVGLIVLTRRSERRIHKFFSVDSVNKMAQRPCLMYRIPVTKRNRTTWTNVGILYTSIIVQAFCTVF
jgi:hypothetical protein